MWIPRRYPRAVLALLLALALLAPTLALTPPARAGDCKVTDTTDNAFGGSLRAKVLDTSCDSISFQAGLGPITLTRTLAIARNLTITGPGKGSLTIRGGGTFPLLSVDVPGGLVVISGLMLAGGHATGGGYGGNLQVVHMGIMNLTDVALVDGTADAGLGGAGAYLGGGYITLTDVTVSGNSAPGSAQYGTGAGLYIDEAWGSTVVTIKNSQIYGNTATANNGGGIAVVRNSGVADRVLSLLLQDNTIVGRASSPNRATAWGGGGIYVSGASLLMRDSIVQYNSAQGRCSVDCGTGGGILLDRSHGEVTVTMLRSTIANNTATSGDGGGIAFQDYVGANIALTITDSTIASNSAPSGGGLSIRAGTATLTNSTLSGNSASAIGGGFYLDDGAHANLVHATITGNTAGVAGGAFRGTSLTHGSIQGSVIAGNSSAGSQTNPSANCLGVVPYAPYFTSAGDNVYGRSDLPNDGIGGGCPATPTDRSLEALGLPPAAVLSPSLATNGGTTKTHALVPGSPALDFVANCPVTTDQRGEPRPQGAACDAGAYELHVDSPSPSPSPTTPPPGSPRLTVPPPPPAQGGVAVARQDNRATLTATPAAGQLFLGWNIAVAGASGQETPALTSWANPLVLTLTADTTATPVFAARPTFGDVPDGDPAAAAIAQLAARGVINGCDKEATPPLFCPVESTLRHQMAALIVRAMPGWADETGLPTFSDNTDDGELMTRVATVQRHGVAQGYQDEVCRERGLTPPCYGPLDTVRYGQVLLFIARAMVEKGYWQLQPDDRTLFPDQNGAEGADPNTDRQTLDHRMVVTYVRYAGAPPEVSAAPGVPFAVNGVAAGGWADASSRAWFARALWLALTSYFGTDTAP